MHSRERMKVGNAVRLQRREQGVFLVRLDTGARPSTRIPSRNLDGHA